MPDKHTGTPPPSRWLALLIYLPSPSFSSFGAACLMCCFRPASSSTPLGSYVYYPSVSLVVTVRYIRAFCDHMKFLYIFDQTSIVLTSGWNSTARIPRLVRRADPLFLPPPCLTSSFLPFLLRAICLASFLPGLTSSALPCFHPPSLQPHRPSSISSLHPGGSGRVAKQAARTSFSFDFKYKMPLVSYTVRVNHFLEKTQMRNLRKN